MPTELYQTITSSFHLCNLESFNSDMKNNQHSHSHPKTYLYKRVVEAKLYIDQHFAEPIDLEQISDQASFSKYHFLRLFKSSFGKSPSQYLREVRLIDARRKLLEGMGVADTCIAVGFESVPSFIHLFKKHYGITPTEFLKQHNARKEEQERSPLSFVPNCFAENFRWKA